MESLRRLTMKVAQKLYLSSLLMKNLELRFPVICHVMIMATNPRYQKSTTY